MANRLPTLDSIMAIYDQGNVQGLAISFDTYKRRIANVIAMCYKSVGSVIIDREHNNFAINIENPKSNSEIAQFYMQHGKLTHAFSHAVYTIHNRSNVWTSVIVENESVIYMVQFAISDYNGKLKMTQILVWNSIAAKGLARKMLLYWLSKYDIVSNNPSQYEEGAAMWKRFITEHITNLYFYRKERSVSKLERLATGYDESSLFGRSKEYIRIQVWVSRQPLI